MTEHMSVKESWDNIAAAVAANPPATDEDIARVEQRIGATLPTDVAQSLRLHNGITESAMWDAFDEEEPPFNGWLLSCDEIIAEWEIWKGLYDTEDWGDSWWTPNLVTMELPPAPAKSASWTTKSGCRTSGTVPGPRSSRRPRGPFGGRRPSGGRVAERRRRKAADGWRPEGTATPHRKDDASTIIFVYPGGHTKNAGQRSRNRERTPP